MFCTKCGKKLKDDVGFCTGCGSAIRQTTDTRPRAETIAEVNNIKKSKIKFLKLAVFAVIALAVLTTGAVLFVGNVDLPEIGDNAVGSTVSRVNPDSLPLVYANKSALYYQASVESERIELKGLTRLTEVKPYYMNNGGYNGGTQSVQFADNGKTAFFSADDKLYRKGTDSSELKKGFGDKDVIAENVAGFYAMSNGKRVIYLNTQRELVFNNLKKDTVLLEDVISFKISPDEKAVLAHTYGDSNLYYIDLSSPTNAKLIAEGISDLIIPMFDDSSDTGYSDYFKTHGNSVDGSSEPMIMDIDEVFYEKSGTLYKTDKHGNISEINKGVKRVTLIDNVLYYSDDATDKKKVSDYFYDDCEEEDKSLRTKTRNYFGDIIYTSDYKRDLIRKYWDKEFEIHDYTIYKYENGKEEVVAEHALSWNVSGMTIEIQESITEPQPLSKIANNKTNQEDFEDSDLIHCIIEIVNAESEEETGTTDQDQKHIKFTYTSNGKEYSMRNVRIAMGELYDGENKIADNVCCDDDGIGFNLAFRSDGSVIYRTIGDDGDLKGGIHAYKDGKITDLMEVIGGEWVILYY